MNEGERIRERRKELGLTLEDVARALGVGKATIHKYETDKIRNIPSDKLKLLARVLQTTPEYLIGWQNQMVEDACSFYDQKIDIENAGYHLEAVPNGKQSYYLNEDAAKAAEELYKRDDLRVLFDAARDVSEEDIRYVATLLEKLKKKEGK
jgi:transcriptional regulator with XRE-family HTH domain|nr:MAG TPA: helix-turn-helix domain protein [Caudoviricetes sp.]